MPIFLNWKSIEYTSPERFIINLFNHTSPRWYPNNIIKSSIYSIFDAYGTQLYSASLSNSRVYMDTFLESADTGSILQRPTSRLYDNFGYLYNAFLLDTQEFDTFNYDVVETGYRNQIRILSDAYFNATTIEGILRAGHAFSGIGLHANELNKEYLGWKLSVYTGSVSAKSNGFYLSNMNIPNMNTLIPENCVTASGSVITYSLTKLGVNTKLYSKRHYYSGIDFTNYGSNLALYEPQLKNAIQNIVRADQYYNVFWNSNYAFWRPGSTPEAFSGSVKVYQDYLYNTEEIQDYKVTGSVISLPSNYNSYDWQYDWIVRTYNDATYKMYVRWYPSSDIPDSVYYTQVNATEDIKYLEVSSGSLGAHYILNNNDIINDVSIGSHSLYRNNTMGTASVYKRARYQNQVAIFKASQSENLYFNASAGSKLNFSKSFSFEFWTRGVDNTFTNAFIQYKNQSSASQIYEKQQISGRGWLTSIDDQFFTFEYSNGTLSGSAGVMIEDLLSEEPSRWHYFAGTYCSGSIYLYIDGVQKYYGTAPFTDLTQSHGSYSSYIMSGSCGAGIDEIAISEGFLSPDNATRRFEISKVRLKEYHILASGSISRYHQPMIELNTDAAKEIEWHEFSIKTRDQNILAQHQNNIIHL